MATTDPSYTTWLSRLVPGWLQGEWGGQLVGLLGMLADSIADAAMQAAKAPWVLQESSPDDAVTLVGTESQLPRYPADTNDGYRLRVHGRWETWAKAGKRPTPTTGGVVEQLLAFGLTAVHMIRNYDWRNAGPPGDPANWSRFWIVIEDTPWTASTWGGFVWGDGSTWGSTATEYESRTIRSIIRQFKAGEDICPAIIVVFEPEIWGDLDLVWGSFTWGGSSLQWPG